jgi:hypothetical protein
LTNLNKSAAKCYLYDECGKDKRNPLFLKTTCILSIQGARLENVEVGKNVSSAVGSNKSDALFV